MQHKLLNYHHHLSSSTHSLKINTKNSDFERFEVAAECLEITVFCPNFRKMCAIWQMMMIIQQLIMYRNWLWLVKSKYNSKVHLFVYTITRAPFYWDVITFRTVPLIQFHNFDSNFDDDEWFFTKTKSI